MTSKNFLRVLVSVVVVLSVVLGYLMWKVNNPDTIVTQSLVKGVILRINNKKDLDDFLNRVDFWNRVSWDGSVVNAIQGKKVKSLKVVFTDVYQWGVKSQDDPKKVSSGWQMINDELVLKIQVSDRGALGNQTFQKEFVRVMSPIDKFNDTDVANMQKMYETKPTFFKLNP